MKMKAIGVVLAAITLFMWGFFSWAVLPWHNMVVNQFYDESVVAQTLREQAPQAGVYYLPSNEEDYQEGATTGFIQVLPDGFGMGMGEMMGLAMVGHVLSVILMMILLMHTSGLNYLGRVRFITLSGLTIGFISHFPYWNWFGFPTSYIAVTILDMTISYCLAGLVLAKFVDPDDITH